MTDEIQSAILRAADAIRSADALLIGAGAGMGVDSGLPDFRGNEGFWKAYPALHGRPFAEMANPRWFRCDPALAWGFYGHRLNLYRRTVPHEGFHILRRLAARVPLGCFVYTSNVDGQFQKAGFPEDAINECHGSIHHVQCADGCSRKIWSANGLQVTVDEATLTADGELPECPQCGGVARPNIMMFDDDGWAGGRAREQDVRYENWLSKVAGKRVVAIEMGAGSGIPTVRWECERRGDPLIRINPREAGVRQESGISIPLGALEALTGIEKALG